MRIVSCFCHSPMWRLVFRENGGGTKFDRQVVSSHQGKKIRKVKKIRGSAKSNKHRLEREREEREEKWRYALQRLPNKSRGAILPQGPVLSKRHMLLCIFTTICKIRSRGCSKGCRWCFSKHAKIKDVMWQGDYIIVNI